NCFGTTNEIAFGTDLNTAGNFPDNSPSHSIKILDSVLGRNSYSTAFASERTYARFKCSPLFAFVKTLTNCKKFTSSTNIKSNFPSTILAFGFTQMLQPKYCPLVTAPMNDFDPF